MATKKQKARSSKTIRVPSIINQPSHYQNVMEMPTRDSDGELTGTFTRVPVAVVDVIEMWAGDNGHLAHALTYLLRAGKKVPKDKTPEQAVLDDLAKAQWWIRRRIDFLGGHPDVPTTY